MNDSNNNREGLKKTNRRLKNVKEFLREPEKVKPEFVEKPAKDKNNEDSD